jgi:hypothetical protein
MTTAYSTNLELALPVQGELSGTWGDTVNNGITQYLDTAIAGSQIISGSQTAVTLTNTNGDNTATNIAQAGSGATGTAQYQIIRCTGNPAGLLTITISDTLTAGYSKTFIIINATSTSQSVKIVGSGPTTGITVASGAKSLVAWNGSDFVEIASSTADGVTTFSAGTTGLTPSTATTGAVTLAGTLATANGGTNLGGATPFTSGGVLYASSTSVLATGSALVFDGTNLGLGVTPSAWNGAFKAFQFGDRSSISQDNSTTYVSNNYVRSDNFRYLVTATASDYYQDSGKHVWRTAASGTAGNVISFTQAMTLAADGNLLLGTATSPSYSGYTTLVLNSASDGGLLDIQIAGSRIGSLQSGSSTELRLFANTSVATTLYGGASERARISAAGNVLVGGTAARGTTAGTAHLDLFNGTAPAGTLTNGVSLYSDSGDLKFMNAAGQAFDVGYRNIPQNAQAGNYTLTLADAGDHIYHALGDGAATYTIPAASSVAFPLGTAITFINLSATSISIAITTDTMYLSSAGTTGTRTLAQYGSATAIKVSGVSSSGIWLISGSGLT